MKTTQSKDGTILAYDVYGSGPPLIYITGASCHRLFKPIKDDAKTFATQFTVYTYDRRGRGDSGNTLPYAVEREVEDIKAIIDAAGGSVFLYGHSSGAVLALEAGLRFGSEVKKVMMYDPPYVNDEKEKVAYKQLSIKVNRLLNDGKNAKAMTTFLKSIGMPKVFVMLLPIFPGWRTMKELAPTLAYDMQLTQNMPPLDRVDQLSVPTQIIVGEQSPKSIHDVGHDLSKAIPDATFKVLSGEDHMADPKILLPVITDFLK